jgi:DNA-binding transcriptional MerR regulator
MLFDTAQVLEISGLSKDTLRVWKQTIPPLSRIDGRKHKYELEQVIGLRLLAQTTQGLGVPISRFTHYAEMLFDQLRYQVPPTGTPLVLCISPTTIFFARSEQLPSIDVGAFIRVGPVVADVLSAVQTGTVRSRAQLELPLEGAKIIQLR